MRPPKGRLIQILFLFFQSHHGFFGGLFRGENAKILSSLLDLPFPKSSVVCNSRKIGLRQSAAVSFVGRRILPLSPPVRRHAMCDASILSRALIAARNRWACGCVRFTTIGTDSAFLQQFFLPLCALFYSFRGSYSLLRQYVFPNRLLRAVRTIFLQSPSDDVFFPARLTDVNASDFSRFVHRSPLHVFNRLFFLPLYATLRTIPCPWPPLKYMFA